MSHWNYRVIRHEHNGETWMEIHEVYYDGNDVVVSYSEFPASVSSSEGVDGLKWVLDKMKECLEKPVLTPADLPG